MRTTALIALTLLLQGCAGVSAGYVCRKDAKVAVFQSQEQPPTTFTCGWSYGFGAGIGILI